MPQKLRKIPIRRIIFSGRMTTIACSLRLDGTSASTHRSRATPLNYFIYPYAEVDGTPFAVESKFSFQDLVSRGD